MTFKSMSAAKVKLTFKQILQPLSKQQNAWTSCEYNETKVYLFTFYHISFTLAKTTLF